MVMPRRGLGRAEIRRMIMALRRMGVSLAAYPSLRERDSRLLAAAMRRLRGCCWTEAAGRFWARRDSMTRCVRVFRKGNRRWEWSSRYAG
jgi:hypothetical protein